MPSNCVFGRASVGRRRVIVSGDDFHPARRLPIIRLMLFDKDSFFARASAEAFLADAARSLIELAEFKDGFILYQGADIKI